MPLSPSAPRHALAPRACVSLITDIRPPMGGRRREHFSDPPHACTNTKYTITSASIGCIALLEQPRCQSVGRERPWFRHHALRVAREAVARSPHATSRHRDSPICTLFCPYTPAVRERGRGACLCPLRQCRLLPVPRQRGPESVRRTRVPAEAKVLLGGGSGGRLRARVARLGRRR